jgi:hypothetical protein
MESYLKQIIFILLIDMIIMKLKKLKAYVMLDIMLILLIMKNNNIDFIKLKNDSQ